MVNSLKKKQHENSMRKKGEHTKIYANVSMWNKVFYIKL